MNWGQNTLIKSYQRGNYYKYTGDAISSNEVLGDR